MTGDAPAEASEREADLSTAPPSAAEAHVKAPIEPPGKYPRSRFLLVPVLAIVVVAVLSQVTNASTVLRFGVIVLALVVVLVAGLELTITSTVRAIVVASAVGLTGAAMVVLMQGPIVRALNTSHAHSAPSTGQKFSVAAGMRPTAKQLASGNLQKADIAGAQFDGLDLRGRHLEEAVANGALFRGTDLRGAWLVGAQLYGAQFQHACLEGVHLEGAGLTGANFAGADVSGATYLSTAPEMALNWPLKAPSPRVCK